MHFPGDSTWQVSSRDGGTFALYVRDALGVSTPTADAIPALTPPVPRLPGAAVPETFGAAWDRWWTRSLTNSGAEFVPLRWPVGTPAQLKPAFEAWRPDPTSPEESDRRDAARTVFHEVLVEVVAQLTGELGHPPRFTLDLTELPVQGKFWQRVGPQAVLISEELKGSRTVIAPLESLLRELAQ